MPLREGIKKKAWISPPRGVSVLLIHHSGKTGGQRGTADKFTQSAYADRYAGASQSSLRRLRKLVCAVSGNVDSGRESGHGDVDAIDLTSHRRPVTYKKQTN